MCDLGGQRVGRCAMRRRDRPRRARRCPASASLVAPQPKLSSARRRRGVVLRTSFFRACGDAAGRRHRDRSPARSGRDPSPCACASGQCRAGVEVLRERRRPNEPRRRVGWKATCRRLRAEVATSRSVSRSRRAASVMMHRQRPWQIRMPTKRLPRPSSSSAGAGDRCPRRSRVRLIAVASASAAPACGSARDAPVGRGDMRHPTADRCVDDMSSAPARLARCCCAAEADLAIVHERRASHAVACRSSRAQASGPTVTDVWWRAG